MILTPVKTITPPDWMASPESRAIFMALQDSGQPPQVLFVGGCVRNVLLGVPVKDADLATIHHPAELVARLEKAGIKVVPTGIDHGTVTAVVNGTPFEITTLRKDVETDGRRAVVAFTEDWAVDATRRDFTMNTLLADFEGNIYDPLRIGINDLGAGKVIFVGEAAERIAEDYLRILRFFRFHGLYGEGEADPIALAACQAAAEKISTLSRERITQEFLQIIGSDNAGATLALMLENRVMADIVHSAFNQKTFNALVGLQKRFGSISIPARLVLLCAERPKHVPQLEKYLLLSKVQLKTLEALFEASSALIGIRERLYRFGRDVGAQSLLLLAVKNDGAISDDHLALIQDLDVPVYPLTGKDLSAIGMKQGPEMGRVLADIETWWIKMNFQPDHEACLERARLMFGD